MCVTRVARVVSVKGETARVVFVDDATTREVDASWVEAVRGDYLEVFADQALSTLTEEEAEWRKQLWTDLRKKLEAPVEQKTR